MNIPIDDSFKNGWKYSEDTEDTKEFDKWVLKAISAFKTARLYGTSWIVILDNSREVSDDLAINNISHLAVLNPQDIQFNILEQNPLNQNYGNFERIINNTTGEEINQTRAIKVISDIAGIGTVKRNNGLGFSIFEKLYQDIKAVYVSHNRANNILSQLSQDVIGIDGLNDILSEQGGEKMIGDRLEIINFLKGILSTLAIDKEDEYYTVNKSLGGVKDVMEQNKLMVASASRIPYSRLFGQQQGGLNNKGEENLSNYYDHLDGIRKTIYIPIIEQLFEMFKEYKGLPKDTKIEFVELNREDEQTKANVDKTKAETIDILFQAGVIEDTEEIAKRYGFVNDDV